MKDSQKAQKTRAILLEAALELFCQNGFENTTMREIAQRAGLATGLAYYYFKSKEEMVFEFYRRTHEKAAEETRAICAESLEFRTRFNAVLSFFFSELRPYRSFIGVLGQFAASPAHPLSPFSVQAKPFRDQAIDMMVQILEGSDLKVSSYLKSSLPTLLWTYQLGLTLYWLNDASENQSKTQQLADKTQDLILKLIGAASLPPLRPFVKAVDEVVQLVIR